MTKLIKVLTVLVVIILFSCNQEKTKVSTIQFIESPTSGNSMQPYLFSNGSDILMSWTQKNNDSVNTINFSTLSDGKWTKSKEIKRGSNWFVNWADFPAIAKNGNNLITHFLQKSDPATFAYDIRVKQSMDLGENWQEDFKLHKDTTLTEHGFATILPYKEDAFFMAWLDGRNTKGSIEGNEDPSKIAMNVRIATVLPNGEVIDDTLIDDRTCDCCQTSGAITPNGPIVVYRNRTDEEVRDIYISRLIDNSWTSPKSIHNDNWVIKGCPVNGPKAATFNNTLAIAWFTAANNIPKVNLTFSDDNGENFAVPIQIDSGKPIGRVDMALIDENNAIVSWMESTDNGAEIKMVKVNKDGTKNTPFVITALSESRASGFPQFELVNDKIFVAWNQAVDKQSTIKTASFPIEALN